jgi:hypothetical protein
MGCANIIAGFHRAAECFLVIRPENQKGNPGKLFYLPKDVAGIAGCRAKEPSEAIFPLL